MRIGKLQATGVRNSDGCGVLIRVDSGLLTIIPNLISSLSAVPHCSVAENDPIKPVAFDLDPFCTNVIICDSVDERKLKIDQKTEFVNFSTELLRYLSSTLPSITIKTGHSVYNPMGAVVSFRGSGTKLQRRCLSYANWVDVN